MRIIFFLNFYKLHFVSLAEDLNVEAAPSPNTPGVNAANVNNAELVAGIEEHGWQRSHNAVKALHCEEDHFTFKSF